MVEDHYAILEIGRDATGEQIKKAYRKLAIKFHPDKNKNGAEKFKSINNSYSILSDTDKKRDYDFKFQYTTSSSSSTSGNYPFAFPSAFNNYRQRYQAPKTKKPTPPPREPTPPPPINKADFDIRETCTITLMDSYQGSRIKAKYSEKTNCKDCESSYKKRKGTKVCITCQGSGFVPHSHTIRAKCTGCLGKGSIIYTVKCNTCNNEPFKECSITLTVPKGVHEGHALRVANKGNLMPDGTRGCLVFKLSFVKDQRFVRQGNDLYISVKISLKEAIMGFHQKMLCTHLDGRLISASQLSGSVIKPNTTRIIESEGMPVYGHEGKSGDMYVKFIVEFPDIVNIPESKEDKEVIDLLFETAEERQAKENVIIIDDDEEERQANKEQENENDTNSERNNATEICNNQTQDEFPIIDEDSSDDFDDMADFQEQNNDILPNEQYQVLSSEEDSEDSEDPEDINDKRSNSPLNNHKESFSRQEKIPSDTSYTSDYHMETDELDEDDDDDDGKNDLEEKQNTENFYSKRFRSFFS